MVEYQVWTKEPGEEDFEILYEVMDIDHATRLVKVCQQTCMVQLTKTESENPNEYIKVDV